MNGEENLRPWLVSVVADASTEPGGIDPATGTDLTDSRAALARLDPGDRALLAMRYVAGLDSSELATALGISPSGTHNRLERLRNVSAPEALAVAE